jgi:hypothetical protein
MVLMLLKGFFIGLSRPDPNPGQQTPLPEEVAGLVDGDAQEPGSKMMGLSQLCQFSEGLKEDFLGHILGIHFGMETKVNHTEYLILVQVNQLAKCLNVTSF